MDDDHATTGPGQGYGAEASPFRPPPRRPLIQRLVPAAEHLRGYRGKTLGRDALAGVTVAALALPAAMAYAELAGSLRVVTRGAGDCLARFECLLDQAAASLDLVDACASRLASLPPGPLSARIPKVLKIPEGHTYAWTEGPLGLSGYYLVSRGGKTPWRLKLRSASFNNVSVLASMLPGQLIADMVAILGSMFFVVGDIDK